MKPAESVAEFESFSEANGIALPSLVPLAGITQLLNFYASVAVEDCPGDSGDMLLFQWGTYDWGDGPHYEVNLTRQFIEASKADDDAISQLRLTFAFPPTPELSAMGMGNRWCKNQGELEPFRTFVLSSPQLCVVAVQDPPAVSLQHEYV